MKGARVFTLAGLCPCLAGSIAGAEPGDTVSVTFPISERTVEKEKVGGIEYTLILKGSTVVFIDPPGRHCPLYQRAHFRDNQVRWVKRERFVPADEIHW